MVDGDTLDFSGTRVRMFGIGEQHSLRGVRGVVMLLRSCRHASIVIHKSNLRGGTRCPV